MTPGNIRSQFPLIVLKRANQSHKSPLKLSCYSSSWSSSSGTQIRAPVQKAKEVFSFNHGAVMRDTKGIIKKGWNRNDSRAFIQDICYSTSLINTSCQLKANQHQIMLSLGFTFPAHINNNYLILNWPQLMVTIKPALCCHRDSDSQNLILFFQQ